MKIIKQYLNFFLISLFFIITNYLPSGYAQEEQKTLPERSEEETIKVYYPIQKPSTEECLKNFDIDKPDFKDPKVIPLIPLLAEYFQCRAVIKDYIDECNNLNPWPDRIETCRKYFNDDHGFYGRLLTAGSITPKVLAICRKEFGLSEEDCKLSAQALLTADISGCEIYRNYPKKFGDCKAMVSGDAKFCSDKFCKEKANYIKAIKSRDIKECDRIKDPLVKSMCQGYTTMDKKICENNKGFEEFRNRYCE